MTILFNLLTGITAMFLLVYVTWLFYLALMNVRRVEKEGKLSKPARYLALPLLALGYLLDFAANMLPMTFLFLELPREWLVTDRVSRHMHSTGFRRAIAGWMCADLLNPFDYTGKHCKG